MLKVILIILILIGFITILLLYRTHKKNEFNSIKSGDEIFIKKDTFFAGDCFTTLDHDEVKSVEYYFDTDEVKYIYTKNGCKFKFLDYIRDNFIVSKFH